MKAVAVLASSAISALGRGQLAYRVGEPGDLPITALRLDDELARAPMRHALVGRVELPPCEPHSHRAERLLELVLDDLLAELEIADPGFRDKRLAVIVGTSSGAMQTIELALRARETSHDVPAELARGASYFAPLRAVHRRLGPELPTVQVLAACASSTLAIGIACRWLEAGLYDLVIAGGYDALSGLVASGFDALGALTRRAPAPFRRDRDGLALGEGAALVALRLHSGEESCERAVLGFGASSDAFHVTAPEPSGAGLSRAAELALADAGLAADAIQLVSAHGTATPFNDAAEARALRRVFGDRILPVHPFKAVIGHTLGAAGALEALAAWDALARGVVPAVPGEGPIAEDARVHLPARHEAGVPGLGPALKLSAAFGGSNAALVLGAAGQGSASTPSRPSRPVSAVAWGPFVSEADLELVLRLAPSAPAALTRADSFSALVLAAVARLLDKLPEPLGRDTAVVLGSASATLEQDELFDQRRRAGLAVEPRRFPPTSPNVPAGWCSIAFGFTAPCFTVGSGPDSAKQALQVAHDLVASGDASAALAVRAEEVLAVVPSLFPDGSVRAGARAVLLARGQGTPVARTSLSWPET